MSIKSSPTILGWSSEYEHLDKWNDKEPNSNGSKKAIKALKKLFDTILLKEGREKTENYNREIINFTYKFNE